MKRVIRANNITNKASKWLSSEGVDKLVSGCTTEEKKLIGKVANSTDPKTYIQVVADVVDTLGIDISSSFDQFISEGIEIL